MHLIYICNLLLILVPITVNAQEIIQIKEETKFILRHYDEYGRTKYIGTPIDDIRYDSIKKLIQYSLKLKHDTLLLNRIGAKIYIVNRLYHRGKNVTGSEQDSSYVIQGCVDIKNNSIYIAYNYEYEDIFITEQTLHHEISSLILRYYKQQKIDHLTPQVYEWSKLEKLFNSYYNYYEQDYQDIDTIDSKLFMSHYSMSCVENDYNEITRILFSYGMSYEHEVGDSIRELSINEFLLEMKREEAPIYWKVQYVKNVWKSFSRFYTDELFERIQEDPSYWVEF